MDGTILALLTAAIAGGTMALQGSLNAALGKVVGLWETTFLVHLIGAAVVAVLIFVFRLGNGGNYEKWLTAPWYTYLGGLLSVIIIYAVVRSIPKVGVAPATTAILLGQVFTAGIIDHLGLFGMERLEFNGCRVVGVLLMAAGAWLLLMRRY